ncbi:MAG: hypothetical protein WC472_01490 [Candidatus Paceibacterota bacterium]
MRKRKSNITLGILVLVFAVIGTVNTIGYLLNVSSVCTGEFEGDPNAKCYPLIKK